MTRDQTVAHWTTGYNYWRAKLAGDKSAEMYPDNPCQGFWRKGIRDQKPSGQWHRTGWEPVAIFLAGDVITGRIGDQDVTGTDLLKLWEYCGGNPISEEWYRAVAERGESWPDAHDPKKNKASAEPDIIRTYDPTIPVVDPMQKGATPEVPKTPEQKLLDELAEHAKGIPTYAKIEDDILLSKAHDLRDKIKKIENTAEAERKKEKDFYLKKGREIDDKWRGVISTAQGYYAEVSTPMNKWVNDKLEAQRLHDERVAEEKRKHDAAVAAAEAANRPAPPPPEPAPAPNLPAPSMQVRSGGGARASAVRVKKIVTITDEAAVYAHFAGSHELTALLLKLATSAINADFTIPGTTWKPEAKV